MSENVKGRFTFRFAAVCFALSAAFEMLNLNDEALLFGHIVVGAGAAAYHVFYAVLFAWLTVGLWNGTRSGYYSLLVVSLIYTIDRLQSIYVGDALNILVRREVANHPEVTQIFMPEDLVYLMTMSTLLFVLGWWGFVGYAIYRRNYFGVRPAAK